MTLRSIKCSQNFSYIFSSKYIYIWLPISLQFIIIFLSYLQYIHVHGHCLEYWLKEKGKKNGGIDEKLHGSMRSCFSQIVFLHGMNICIWELQTLTFQSWKGSYGSNKKIKVPCLLHIYIYEFWSDAETWAEKTKVVAIF